VGYPQFSAVLECSNAAHGVDAQIVSDGGIQHVGDFGKAFGGGADFVMCGSMFSGHDECNSDVIEENGKKYCVFYGMSSAKAMNKYSGGVAKYRSAEGKCVKVPYKGPVEDTVLNILGGIRSTMTYIGASKIKHIPKCAHFMRVNNQVNKIYAGSEIN
jgi:GMP reductase